MIFDTHAHYDDEAFDKDREELLASMTERGIEYIVNVGASLEGCRTTLALAEKYPFIYAAIGVHPDEVGALDEAGMAALKEMCGHEKAVAVGEIGLDYYGDKSAGDVQARWFRGQLGLARELGLPVIIHSREAAADTFDIMKDERVGEIGGVVHCYSYSPEMAMDYVRMGLYIGIGGVVTFKNARKLKETVACVPLERILLETDCPYLSPEPNRGKRNSSLNLPYVAAEIARIKGVEPEEVVEATSENAKRLFFGKE